MYNSKVRKKVEAWALWQCIIDEATKFDRNGSEERYEVHTKIGIEPRRTRQQSQHIVPTSTPLSTTPLWVPQPLTHLPNLTKVESLRPKGVPAYSLLHRDHNLAYSLGLGPGPNKILYQSLQPNPPSQCMYEENLIDHVYSRCLKFTEKASCTMTKVRTPVLSLRTFVS